MYHCSIGRSASIKVEKYNDYMSSHQFCKKILAPFDQITTKITRGIPHAWLGCIEINLGEKRRDEMNCIILDQSRPEAHSSKHGDEISNSMKYVTFSTSWPFVSFVSITSCSQLVLKEMAQPLSC